MKNLLNEEVDLLRHNARSVVRELGLLNDAYFEIGVTLAERHLLIELTSLERPTAGELADRLLIDKSTASRLIAKAVKKGYVKCSLDEKDKRKRFLQLTEIGKQTLNAFEPIAFNQTKEALLTLTAEEIEIVYQGVSLYAKGLKNSRLGKNSSVMLQDAVGAAK
jgi:putative acetyltransferase